MNRPAFTSALLIPLYRRPDGRNAAHTTMQAASSSGRRPSNRHSQSSFRRVSQQYRRRQSHADPEQKKNKRYGQPIDNTDDETDAISDDEFYDDNDNGPNQATQRPQNSQRVFDDYASVDENDIGEDEQDNALDIADGELDQHLQSSVDDLAFGNDSFDNGLFMRSRKNAAAREEVPVRQSSSNSFHNRRHSRANKEAASSAFDAVDRLFDTFKSDKTGSSPVSGTPSTSNRASIRSTRSTSQPSSQRHDHPNNATSSGNASSNIDRRTWLENIKARAATKSARSSISHSRTNQFESSDNTDTAVDIDAVEDVSTAPGSYEVDDESKRGVSHETGLDKEYENDIPDSAEIENFRKVENDGEEDEGNDGEDEEELQSHRQNSHRNVSQKNTNEGIIKRKRSHENVDDKDGNSSSKSKFRETTFATLLKIARHGPVGDPSMGARRKIGRAGRNSGASSDSGRGAATLAALTGDVNTDGLSGDKMSYGRNTTRVRRDQTERERWEGSERGDGVKGNVSQRLNQIMSKHDRRGNIAYEPTDDEMERVIDLSTETQNRSTRQRFTSVRRLDAQRRQVLTPPSEWRPLTAEEVASVVSDSRPLRMTPGKNKAQVAGAVSECTKCSGTGLETCAVCVGEGWIPSLSTVNKRQELDVERAKLLDEIWATPNLVVNSEGEAQCIRCNSIGKQLCHTCKGSGSSLHKGFSMDDKYKAFDLFGGSANGPPDVDFDFERYKSGDADEEDEEEDEEEDDIFDEDGAWRDAPIYRGSAETLDLFRKNGMRNDINKVDDDDEIEDVNVEDGYRAQDESAELFATLEAMDLADAEDRQDRDQSLDERLGIRSRPLQVRNVHVNEDNLGLDDDDEVDAEDNELVEELDDELDDDDDVGDVEEEAESHVVRSLLHNEDDDDDLDDDVADDDDGEFDEVEIDDSETEIK